MKLLSVDTSTGNSSVCIIEEDQVLVEISLDIGQTHSRHMMTMIQDALDLSRCTLSDLEGFAVVVGPGSFTGLRIGLSTIKGLAVTEGKPVVGISSLDALAFQFGLCPAWVCVMLDARKNEVYSALYENTRGLPKKIKRERVGAAEKILQNIQGPCLFVGDGARLYRSKIVEKMGETALFPLSHENRIKASSVAYLGRLKFQNNDVDSIETLVPCYIRPSDAQIKTAPFP